MNEYTPLKKPKTKPKSATDRFREQLIIDTTCAWIKHCPEEARDFAIETKTLKEAQRKKHGGCENGGQKANIYVKYRMPQSLLDHIRLMIEWAEVNYGEKMEVFGLDDKDMKLLVQQFPVLFGHAHNMVWGKNAGRSQ